MRSSTPQQARIIAKDRFDHRPILVDFCAFNANRAQSGFSADRLCHYMEHAITAARVGTEGGSLASLDSAAAQLRSLTSGTGFATRTIAASLATELRQNLRTEKLVLVHFGCTGKIFACYGVTSHRSTGCLDLGKGSSFQR